MDSFDRIFEIIVQVVPMAMALVTLIVGAVNKPNVSTTWGKVQYIIGRIFSLTTYKNAGAKQGYEFKLPVLESADPVLTEEVDNAAK